MLEGRILFVGGGRMAQALVGGLLREGVSPDRIAVSDPDPAQQRTLRERHGLSRLFFDNPDAYRRSAPDIVLFAVKPGAMAAVATDLAPWMIVERPLLLSIAAGVRAADVARWTGGACPVVRAMPNTPALAGAAMSVLYAGADVTAAHRDQAERILAAVGATAWVEEESLMDAATAVSGSGPAYVFAFLEALMAGAQAQGLDAAQARTLVLETARGALLLAQQDGRELAALRAQVTSPGGTTAAALDALQERDFAAVVQAAVAAAMRRARDIGDENSRA